MRLLNTDVLFAATVLPAEEFGFSAGIAETMLYSRVYQTDSIISRLHNLIWFTIKRATTLYAAVLNRSLMLLSESPHIPMQSLN